ncbi:MAG: hypothetical protein RCO49_05965 [Rickettsia endosymbiont of Argas persicus]
MPVFSDLKPELKQEIENIMKLAKQENVNNEELTIKCKNFFELVFSDNHKFYIKECYQAVFNYVKHNFSELDFIPDPVIILMVHLSCYTILLLCR